MLKYRGPVGMGLSGGPEVVEPVLMPSPTSHKPPTKTSPQSTAGQATPRAENAASKRQGGPVPPEPVNLAARFAAGKVPEECRWRSRMRP